MLVFQHYVDLPSFIRKTKSVINIKNNDEYCFCGLLWYVEGGYEIFSVTRATIKNYIYIYSTLLKCNTVSICTMDDIVQCPYNPFHMCLKSRLSRHKWKCHNQEYMRDLDRQLPRTVAPSRARARIVVG
jgi:hypothetical protein